MNYIAHFFSWIFLPLLMPIYGLILALYMPSSNGELYNNDSLYYLNDEAKSIVLYMFVVFSAIAPAASFLLLRMRNVISTIDMENRRERSIPMYIMLSFCLLLYVLFLLRVPAGNPKFIFSLPLSGVLVTFFYTIINRWIKISLHGGGAGILTGFIFAYYLNQEQFQFWVFFAVILASALTISSRLYLKKHTETEVYSGWALALVITFVANYYYPHL
ncbi:MAG: hypothetical protein RIT10_1582 [Bacteroidota bacterium]|jgi:hypothetical protein